MSYQNPAVMQTRKSSNKGGMGLRGLEKYAEYQQGPDLILGISPGCLSQHAAARHGWGSDKARAAPECSGHAVLKKKKHTGITAWLGASADAGERCAFGNKRAEMATCHAARSITRLLALGLVSLIFPWTLHVSKSRKNAVSSRQNLALGLYPTYSRVGQF